MSLVGIGAGGRCGSGWLGGGGGDGFSSVMMSFLSIVSLKFTNNVRIKLRTPDQVNDRAFDGSDVR